MSDKRMVLAGVIGHLLAVVLCLTPLAFLEPIAVRGGSMLPTLAPGDLALVSRGGEVSAGDVALVREPGHSAVLHRVVSVDESGSYHTRGDANPVGDIEPVDGRSISGKVLATIPFGKLTAHWRDLR